MTQQEALDILKTGRSVFLTGAAGSGKTYVLRQYIEYLKEHGVSAGVTASTGIAATHLSGMTIHAWSGIGIHDTLSTHDIESIKQRTQIRNKIQSAQTLIIDEVSMLHHFRLDLVDQVLRTIRGGQEPFGGMQVILCGDFFQLPPVSRLGEEAAKFVYHADSWKELNPAICYLEEQHRQDDDAYLSILNAIRDDSIDTYHRELLESRMSNKTIRPTDTTVLHSHNANVDIQNECELETIKGQIFEYKMYTHGPQKLVETLVKGCLAPEVLRLKAGARVMFIKNNFEQGYVNGTLGVVEHVAQGSIAVRTLAGKRIAVSEETWQIEEDGAVKARISQYPLRLAWAITIHKSQGMSMDAAHIDLSRAFGPGMGYVALSRVRTLAGLTLAGMNAQALRVHEEVIEQDRHFREQSLRDAAHIRMHEKRELEHLHATFKAHATKDSKVHTKVDTVTQTLELVLAGKNSKEIALIRDLKRDTILDHLAQIKEQDPFVDLSRIKKEISASRFAKIKAAFQQEGTVDGGKRPLGPVKNRLGASFPYDELKLVRLFL